MKFVPVYELLQTLYDAAKWNEGTVRDLYISGLLMNALELWLRNGDFPYVDRLLTTMDIERLPPAALIGALSITSHGKAHLNARADFVVKVEISLRTRLGDDRTTKLLETRR